MSKWLKSALQISAVAIVGFTLTLCSVPFLGYYWHLRHGDSISFAGWKIEVPKRYEVVVHAKGPALWRYSLGVPLVDAAFGHISFYEGPRPFHLSSDYSAFEKAMYNNARESGHELKGSMVIPVGNTSAYCVEFGRKGKQPQSLVRCMFDGEGIGAFYEGSPTYIPDFFTMLRQMSLEKPRASATDGRT
jgi:hypothetical protein